jgi:hypothetical protein
VALGRRGQGSTEDPLDFDKRQLNAIVLKAPKMVVQDR